MMAGTLEASDAWLVSVSTGGCSFRWRRSANETVAQWVGILTLRVDAAGVPTFAPWPDADPVLVQKLRATTAVAFLRALCGLPSLHGSAVAHSTRAIACLGGSGAGKSTAAARLCATGQFELLADDVVALEPCDSGWRVIPTESAHWLSREGYVNKVPLHAPCAKVAADFAAAVVLRFDERSKRPQLRRLRGAELYSALSSAAIRFERATALHLRELDVFASLAQGACIYELVRPRTCDDVETAGILKDLLGSK